MSLKEVYGPYFKMGVALPGWALSDPRTLENMSKEYHTFTCENEMKPEGFLDREENLRDPKAHDRSPAVHLSQRIRGMLDFAKENNFLVRGHTLVWHGQTPRWFFSKNYEDSWEAPLADRETMLARMECYIRSVVQMVEHEYPGIVYAWDVVNEAVNDGDLRKSLWTETVGEDFFMYAFRYARKYCAQGVSLFYNDYTTYEAWKRDIIMEKILKPLMAEKLVDGMGMQSHLLMNDPAMEEYEKTVEIYGATGLELNITELDIHNADPSEASMDALAERYEQLFTILLRVKKSGIANVTNVTLWGLHDDASWLTGFRREKSYPLLFEKDFTPKKAYYAVIGVPEKLGK